MTSENFARSIALELSDSKMLAKVAHLGEAIRNEPDGVIQAVRLIEKITVAG